MTENARRVLRCLAEGGDPAAIGLSPGAVHHAIHELVNAGLYDHRAGRVTDAGLAAAGPVNRVPAAEPTTTPPPWLSTTTTTDEP